MIFFLSLWTNSSCYSTRLFSQLSSIFIRIICNLKNFPQHILSYLISQIKFLWVPDTLKFLKDITIKQAFYTPFHNKWIPSFTSVIKNISENRIIHKRDDLWKQQCPINFSSLANHVLLLGGNHIFSIFSYLLLNLSCYNYSLSVFFGICFIPYSSGLFQNLKMNEKRCC